MTMRSAEFLDVAAGIGRRLALEAIWSGDRCNWLGWAYQADGARIQPVYRAMGPALGTGTAGIGLFLAELARSTGDPVLRQTARGALAQTASCLDSWPLAHGTGLYSGLPGAAIAFALAARALEDERLAEAARAALARLLERGPRPEETDLFGGAAGAALVLLDAGAGAGDDRLIEAAMGYGRLLVERANRFGETASWMSGPMPGHPDLVGYPHGASGIAVALLELFAAGGEMAFRDTAHAALAYEAKHFDRVWNLWPDLRLPSPEPPLAMATPARYPVAWIHGAVGVGMARLRIRELLPERAETAAEIEAAVAGALTTLAPGTLPTISFALSTGVAGAAEFLMAAAAALGRHELAEAARQAARYGELTHLVNTMPWPCGGPPNGECADLLLGLAGIGRFYLGLAEPDRVRTLLSFHPRQPVKRPEAPAPELIPVEIAPVEIVPVDSAPTPTPPPEPEPEPEPEPAEPEPSPPTSKPRARRASKDDATS